MLSISLKYSTRLTLWVATLVAVLGLASCADARSELVERTVTVGKMEREYRAYIPESAKNGQPISVLFAFHPGFGTGKGFVDQTNIHRAPGAENFIVVYPEGFRRSWNSGDCCGPAMRRNVDDLGFVEAMFADLQQFANISPDRNFATGFSNGFAFSQELACRMPDRFAAIAGGGGVKDTDQGCSNAKPISVFVMHGLADEHSPFAGGQSKIRAAGYRVSIDKVERFWSRENRCSATRSVSKLNGISCTTYTGCAGGNEVTICPIPGMGHWWPGQAGSAKGERMFGPARGDLDGSAAVVQFFNSKR